MTTVVEFEVPQIIKENKRSFVQIPQFDALIAVEQTHGRQNADEQLVSLHSENLSGASLRYFMSFRENVRQKKSLLYADGTEVSQKIVKDLWRKLSSDIFVNLNTRFYVEENNWSSTWYLEDNLKVTPEGLKGTRELLDTTTLHEDCLADLAFNSQGLPIIKSANSTYVPLQNIGFYYPRNGQIARFYADSGWADLSCDRGPTLRYSGLGVLASAEGASEIAKILGGRK